MKKTSLSLAVLCMVLSLTACATTEQSAGLGALFGAGAGAIIGHQFDNAAAGALVGAVVGGVAGGLIGHEKQKRVADREEVEQEYTQSQSEKVSRPITKWETFDVTPNSIKPGDTLVASGRYVVVSSEPSSSRNGSIALIRDGNVLHSASLENVNEGRYDFEKTLQIPEDMEGGEYKLRVKLVNGESVSSATRTFIVANAT